MSALVVAATDPPEPRLGLLLELGALIQREVDLDELLDIIGDRVAEAVEADRATVWLVCARTGALRTRIADLPEADQLALPVGRGVVGYVVRTGEPVVLADVTEDGRWSPEVDQKTGYRTRSMVCVAIRDRLGRIRGAVQVLNKRRGTFGKEDKAYLDVLAAHVARSLEHTSLRAADSPSGVCVRGRFNHVVGDSPAIRAVYDRITRAAATDATVLLRGETGTGKGLFARAIHVNSARRDQPFVQVDGTTLPEALVESELFGHERGAYTGAEKRVIGQVERAQGGTLFIDEIGEIPPSVQAKLLRFIQDREFERVGGRETLSADVRIVTATNRDLAVMVRTGQFREDLYYRIRVIDVDLPPLRNRGADDILSLAEHFVGLYCQRHRRPGLRLTADARSALASHRWPGNVRELEHTIERAVVLASSDRVDAAALALAESPPTAVDSIPLAPGLALDDVAVRYAKATLAACDGNRSAAARVLCISRNRLSRLLG